MQQLIYDDDGVQIFRESSRFHIRYDAGAHQVAIREDEISEEEAKLAMSGTAGATQVLFSLQRKLTAAGVDPYVSNTVRD